MTGIILTGGKNTRMGENKAFIEINGEKIIERTMRIFREVFDEIILITNSPLEYLDYDVRIVTDLIKGKSALGGIYTGLFYASCDHAFFAACDMPFLRKDFIEYMAGRIDSNDIVVPNPPDGFQPLHAIYSKRCLPHIKALIDKDKLKIRGFYKKSKTRIITADEIEKFDPEGRMFLNVNSQEDLDKIRV
jgi:molybdopterin-guanine dinucleotide biosynthesis protein A